MNRIAVIGYKGRMGSIVFEQLKDSYDLIGIDKNDNLDLAINADLVIDFSSGENSLKTAEWCAENKIPLIIGATGQNKNELNLIKTLSNQIPILKAGNFSLGIAKIKQILSCFNSFKFENIYICEKHHKNKKDCPSGTAIELKNFISEKFNTNVEILALRGGEEIGMHEINLYFDSELITISHQAFSRKAFVRGVMLAVNYMLEQTHAKMYCFEEIL